MYNEHLNFVQALPLRVRLVNFIYFWESKRKLVTAGIDGCFIFDFISQAKYDPRQAIFLDPDGRSMKFEIGQKIKLESMPLWIKGMKVDETEGMIFTWSQVKTCFNDLETGALVFKYKQLTKYEDYITDLIISEKFKYFITSTFFGSVFVWKLSET